MTNDELKARILEINSQIEIEEETKLVNVNIPSAGSHEFFSALKNTEDLKFDFMFCQTGVDWPEHMTVVYHLRSTTLGHEIVVKAKIEDREKPEIDSVFDLYKTADFHEREIFDLFGINFKGHPDMRRIFLEDDWVGFPLRKDYVDEVNIVEL